MKRILVVVLFAAVSFAQQAPKKLPIKTDVSPSAPRYQLFVNPEIRRDTLLLDTVTGKIWRMTEMSGPLNQPTVWKYEDRIDNNEQEIAWWKSHAPDLDHRDQLQASPKPKIDDVDPQTGKPKYANYSEYEDAKDQWNRQETIREFQALPRPSVPPKH